MGDAPSGVPSPQFDVLVLAGDRGPDDPLVKATGVPHKCLVPVGGKPMVERVVGALDASPWVRRIALSVADQQAIEALPSLRPLVAAGRVITVAMAGSPSRSVLSALETMTPQFPLLITTADHALLTAEMVDHFCSACAEAGGDVGVGVTGERVVSSRYPETKRTYLRFRDDRYSGSNLFALMSPAATAVVRLWVRVEQQRKQPWRIASVFGPSLLIGYLLGRMSLDQALEKVSARLGLTVGAVRFPFPEAPIDVDKPEDLVLVEEIVRRQGGLSA